jgi:hypothetical protein
MKESVKRNLQTKHSYEKFFTKKERSYRKKLDHPFGRCPNPVTQWWIDMNNTMKLYVPKTDLKIGAFYYGSCRNASIARWEGEKFKHLRTKFGDEFFETIFHFEDDNGYDLFMPYFELEDEDKELPWIQDELEKYEDDPQLNFNFYKGHK